MLIQDLIVIAKSAQRAANEKVKSLGFTTRENTICNYLYLHQEASQDKIAKTLLIDKATVAKILKKLEDQKIIERKVNPNNRRQNIITLSDGGSAVIKEMIGFYDAWTDFVMDELSEEEKAQFYSYLKKIKHKAMS